MKFLIFIFFVFSAHKLAKHKYSIFTKNKILLCLDSHFWLALSTQECTLDSKICIEFATDRTLKLFAYANSNCHIAHALRWRYFNIVFYYFLFKIFPFLIEKIFNFFYIFLLFLFLLFCLSFNS